MSGLVNRVLSLVTTSAGHVALNPLVTAALLWILTKAPEQLRNQLTARIAALRDPRRYAQVVRMLKWCLAFGTMRVVNQQMNHIALNAGRIRSERARWNWSQEVAVITGGCSGIGELVVKRLVHKGIKVAVLDIQQLPLSLQGCKMCQSPLPLPFVLTKTARCKHQTLYLRCHKSICSLYNRREGESNVWSPYYSDQQCWHSCTTHHPDHV